MAFHDLQINVRLVYRIWTVIFVQTMYAGSMSSFNNVRNLGLYVGRKNESV